MPKVQSASSTEGVRVPVAAVKLGEPYDPTGDPVAMAFLPAGQDPTNGDAHTASWETWTTNGTPTYYATCLVGPVNGGVVLAEGKYRVWVKITDNPDVPWLNADVLVIN